MSNSARRWVTIGRLGPLLAEPGFYLYAGSARGPGGLRARIGRHLKREKKLRWHVDYLRRVVDLHAVWWTAGLAEREHQWADALTHLSGASIPLARFGASDCGCRAHLVRTEVVPSLDEFVQIWRTDESRPPQVSEFVTRPNHR